jgi:probable rRNA maturation factor
VDIAKQNAKRLGHATAEEVKILCLHGLLHLAGFDHEHDQGQMAREERNLRRRLGLISGLTERTPTTQSKP